MSPNALAQHLDENLVRHVTILRERVDELGDTDHPTSREGSRRRANMTSATQSSGGGAAGNIQPQAQSSRDSSGIPEKLQIVEVKVTTFESIVGVLNTEIEKCVLKLDASDRQSRTDKEQSTQANRKLKDLERQLALKDVTIAELDLRIQVWLMPRGPIIN